MSHYGWHHMKTIISALLMYGCLSVSTASAADYSVNKGVVYTEPEGQSLTADIYQPETKGLKPAVIVIHGGGWNGGEPSDMDKFAELFAEQGYVVMNISYRLAPEYTHPAQLRDCQSALLWLGNNAQQLGVDTQRIAAMGYSAGGHLALLLGLNSHPSVPYRIRAIIDGAGPTDLRKYPSSPLVNGYLGGPPEGQRVDAYADASPVTYVKPSSPPVFIYHGKRDWTVGIEQSHDLVARLQQVGVPVTLYEARFGHVVTFLAEAAPMREALKFLDVHMQ